MKILLDQGLPRTAAELLRSSGVEAQHIGELGLSTASDHQIIELASHDGWIIVTLDADFHTILVMTGAGGPSVIRIRIEGLKAKALTETIGRVLASCRTEIERGAMLSVDERHVRIRALPVAPLPNRGK